MHQVLQVLVTSFLISFQYQDEGKKAFQWNKCNSLRQISYGQIPNLLPTLTHFQTRCISHRIFEKKTDKSCISDTRLQLPCYVKTKRPKTQIHTGPLSDCPHGGFEPKIVWLENKFKILQSHMNV